MKNFNAKEISGPKKFGPTQIHRKKQISPKKKLTWKKLGQNKSTAKKFSPKKWLEKKIQQGKKISAKNYSNPHPPPRKLAAKSSAQTNFNAKKNIWSEKI